MLAVPTINSCSFDITFQDPDYKTDYIKIQTDYKMNTNLKVHKLVHKLFLTKNGVKKMTEMILKWNPAYGKYGAVYQGKWYREWLPTQQEMCVNGGDCTLQFRFENKLNHGFYVTSDHELVLDGLVVDLPFDPNLVINIVY